MRYLVWLSFDGTRFHGWQIQPNGVSVQQCVQDSLSCLLRQPIDVVGAGRTDAGVHARVMPCHFDYVQLLDCNQLCYRLNKILPKDISCNKILSVADDVHARFSARRRTYRYFVHTYKSPFLRHYSLETHFPLDFNAMNHAGEWLCQIADFKAFCKAGSDAKTTFCKLYKAQWVEQQPGEWYFEIAANRFLRNMVRAVVGTLFQVGRNKITFEEFQQIVEEGSRSEAGESMPAYALFLWDVEYEKL